VHLPGAKIESRLEASMDLGLFLQSIVNSLILSSMYIVVALGFALLLSIMGILNFAHGAIYMVGGYLCYQFTIEMGINQWLALLMTALIMGLFGLFLEKFFFRPFQGGDETRTIFVTLALIVILEGLTNVAMGGYKKSIPALVPDILQYGYISVSWQKVITFGIGVIALISLLLFIRKTKTGKQMLAISQDMVGAALQGIKIHRVSAFAVSISCALAAVAGSLLGSILSLSPYMGDTMLVKAIEIVVLGGIGSIGGVLVAGFILGSIDAALPVFISGHATDAIALGLIIIILLFRPRGLFGHEA
jgi:branched-chain amino acid transport system permease protein